MTLDDDDLPVLEGGECCRDCKAKLDGDWLSVEGYETYGILICTDCFEARCEDEFDD